MPQNRNSETPPKVMTWPKAIMPVLIVAGVFDLLRAFFNLFWFFGPAIAALYCSSTVSDMIGSVWGLTKVACDMAAVAAGVYFSPVIASFGVIMADAVALLGFLLLTALVFGTNARILKTVQTAMMQIGASFGIAALPFIGAIPTFTITLYKLYRRQIKLEKAAYKKWEKAQAAEKNRNREQEAAEIIQARNAQAVQMQQQEAANDEMYAEAEQEKEPREVMNEKRYEPAPARVIPRLVAVPDYTKTIPPPLSQEVHPHIGIASPPLPTPEESARKNPPPPPFLTGANMPPLPTLEERARVNPPPPPFIYQGVPPPPPPPLPTLLTKERKSKDAELLSAREASKKFFSGERKKLAEEIRGERKVQRDRLVALTSNIEVANSHIGASTDNQYAVLSVAQSSEADTFSQRLSSGSEMNPQDAQDERENISQLINSSENLALLKSKLEELYARSDERAKENFESVRKSVEQVLLRNNAFIVHTFTGTHNENNSNVSNKTSLEDDVDILLSLEPSISTSSVVPGSKQGLWADNIGGVVIGGGDIQGAASGDDSTLTRGIKKRTGRISSSQEIDEEVSNKNERISHNELVVNNPEIFGFFINVDVDTSGKMIGFKAEQGGGKYDAHQNKKSKEAIMGHINLAINKGLPPLIMTPDRRLFEFVDISDNGTVTVGKEITPEQVARGNAGLSNEKRRELGEKIIDKNLFQSEKALKEAKGIVSGLSKNDEQYTPEMRKAA